MKNKLIAVGVVLFLAGVVEVGAQEKPPVPPSEPEPVAFDDLQEKMEKAEAAMIRAERLLGRRQRMALNEKQEQETLEWISGIDPDLAQSYRELKTEAPKQYRSLMRNAFFTMKRMERIRRRSPERYEHQKKIHVMEARTRILGIKFRRSEDEREKDKIRDEMRTMLDTLFDLREKDRQAEIKRLEKELARLRESLTLRRKNKDRIIERRIDELTGVLDELHWD